MDGDSPQSIDLPDDMIYTESDSEIELDESRSPSPPRYPPSIDELKLSVNSCNSYSMCLKSSQDINGLIKNIDQFYFKNKSTKKKYTDDLHAFLKRCRDFYAIIQEFSMKKPERSPTPPDEISTKKHKQVEVIKSNKFDALQTPQTQENEDVTGATAENHNVVRPPPPITIDNVRQSHRLFKKLQDITKQKIRGKIIGKGLRVYPENPEAYHTIRRYVDAEKLESFTYQLDEEKDLKAPQIPHHSRL
ncbi:hypothetical protein TNCV_3945781 [Trichonephila clavipes]|nr:hypothetical protein TNCV_3945781 [Trichonephila clavipes]